MKRSEVKDKLVLVNEAIAKIENNDDVVLYITKDKHLAELQTSIKLEKLIAAKKVLNKHLSDDDKFDLDTVGIDELI